MASLFAKKKIALDASIKYSDVLAALEKSLNDNKVNIKERTKTSIDFNDVNFSIGFNFWKGLKGSVAYDKESNQIISETNHPVQAIIGIVVMSLLIYIHKSPMVMYASFGLVIINEFMKYKYFVQYLKNLCLPPK